MDLWQASAKEGVPPLGITFRGTWEFGERARNGAYLRPPHCTFLSVTGRVQANLLSPAYGIHLNPGSHDALQGLCDFTVVTFKHRLRPTVFSGFLYAV